jgi:hypothetical protein
MNFLKHWFKAGGVRDLVGWFLSAGLAVYLPTAWLVITVGFIAVIIVTALYFQFVFKK